MNHSQSRRPLFVLNFHPLASRNFFTTDVLETLLKDSSLRLVVLVPSYKLDFFKEHYRNDRVAFEGFDESSVTRTLWFRFFNWLCVSLVPSATQRMRLEERLWRQGKRSFYLKYWVTRMVMFLSRFSVVRDLARALDYGFAPKHLAGSYLDKYDPFCVISTDVFSASDLLFLHVFRKRHSPAIGMVRSWDNTYTKGLMRSRPDRIIVNNEIIAQEAVHYHDIPRERIFVGGIPQYDLSFRGGYASREQFFAEIGVDPTRRLLLFAPAGYILSDTDWQLCEMMKMGIREGKLPSDIHVLVRSHPCDPAPLEKFVPDEHFTIERPGHSFDKRKKATEFSVEDTKHLIDSLYHCDQLIQVNSTIGIDSLPFDKPQIMIEFDGWENKPYLDSVKRYHDEDHMMKFLVTGAAKVVRNPDELFAAIRTYFENPALDREGRKRALAEQIYKVDGKSGVRVGEHLRELARAFSHADALVHGVTAFS